MAGHPSLAGTRSGRRSGTLAGAVAFGPATASFRRPYRARVTTVEGVGNGQGSPYRSQVNVKAKGRLG